jgi:amino acid transporter
LIPGAALLFPTLVVVMLTVVNYFGTLSAARFHTALTLAKLLPLLLFVILGSLHLLLQPESLGLNLHPFLPHGLSHFGEALVLVFWAYAGFEHATFPAQEIREPGRTLPLALISGLGIATAVYLSVSLLIAVALPAAELSDSPNPLGEAFTHLVAALFPTLASLAAWIITAGALLSILGADEAGTLTTAWLIFALAADGHLPSFLTRLHPRHRTPYLALLVQNALVLAASLLLPLENLIRATTFLLGVTYLLSCAAAVKLASRQRIRGFLGSRYLAYPGIASCFLLLSQARGPEIMLGTLMLAPALIGRLALGSRARVNRFRYTRFPECYSGIAAALQYRFLAQTYLWLTAPGRERSSRQEKREA